MNQRESPQFSGCPQLGVLGVDDEVNKQPQSDVISSRKKANVRL